ncbi:MAG TPA: hypothetical protein VN083_07710 [Vicinamibacteria bacterium]|jgi:hypothetical protein|nr:hypothetical protein [Vicinamibacteria bacterium]
MLFGRVFTVTALTTGLLSVLFLASLEGIFRISQARNDERVLARHDYAAACSLTADVLRLEELGHDAVQELGTGRGDPTSPIEAMKSLRSNTARVNAAFGLSLEMPSLSSEAAAKRLHEHCVSSTRLLKTKLATF